MISIEPQGHTHAEQLAWRAQGIVIRAAVQRGSGITPVPSVERLAKDLQVLVDRQRAEIRLELLMEIMSAKAAEQARGMLIAKMASDERQRIADLTAILERERRREGGSELELEGGENSTMYPPKK